ncbi:dethiobiotin synthase [Thioflexithrix psekupsensis]|uniref:ATP-dependent dethiobiotin synthetase BioD n=1 Tax=Thioflexithrix psekupsensis TaxID=1570016 RepID=A0A251XA37_9GAMM|nr:dethiobiotin synthase [Thioflexithrix psekupsensis]OUD14587.1 dethiobiotin synthase [Thioflexithrix psekupsensis]
MPHRHTYFITGTDTEIGKTTCTVALLHHFKQLRHRTAAMKPIASGCEWSPEGWRNADAIALQHAMTEPLSYHEVNPITLPEPIAPHLAAQLVKKSLDVATLTAHYQQIKTNANIVLIEGVGGWRVPLNDKETLADLVRSLTIPVILVVGMRLGCINHALLTAEVIAKDGCLLQGWIANYLSPPQAHDAAVLMTLQQRLNAPLWATLNYQAQHLSIHPDFPPLSHERMDTL